MKRIIIMAMLVMACGGCMPKCTDPNSIGHTWGMWQNDWEKPNQSGFMSHSRTCTICGWEQRRIEGGELR
jgi:hypothetical protein